MILIGFYPIPIKEVEPPDVIGARYELVVLVFHVFFIPVFPFKKYWVLNRDGQEDVLLTEEANRELNNKYGRKRFPWYTYSWLIIIPLVFLWNIADVSSKIRYLKYEKDAFVERSLGIKEKEIRRKQLLIQYPSKNDYYILFPGCSFPDNYHDDIFRVVDFTDDSIKFQISLKDRYLNWSRNEFNKWDQYFDNPNIKFKYRMISKAVLDSLVSNKVNDLKEFSEKSLIEITDGKCIRIESIERRPK